MTHRSGFSGRPLLGQLAVALVILVVLAVGKAIFIPIALAALAATLLGPIVSRWERAIGRAAASLAAVVFMVAVVMSCIVFAGAQVAIMARELPDHAANVSRKLGDMRLRNNSTIAHLDDTLRELAKQLEEAPLNAPLVRVVPQADSITSRLTPVGFVLEEMVTGILVVTLVFFLLLHAQTVNDKIRRLFGRANVATTSAALRKASQRIGHYLLLQTITNSMTGSLVAVVLLTLGVPHAVLFGLMTAILRFIPYVGTTFGAALPTLLAFAVSPDWVLPVATFCSILAIDSVFAYLIEPIWFGREMGVSPIVLPLSAMVWTWMWGPIGLILSTPIAVSLQVIGETVPSLGFLDVIFGIGSQLDPHLQFLGRLLARNKEAAVELAERLEAELGIEALYEQVLTPAFAEVETASSEGRVDADAAREALETTCAIIARPAAFEVNPRGLRILVAAPGSGGADPGALMAGQILRSRGHEVSYLPPEPDLEAALASVFRIHAQVLVVAVSRQGQVEAATALVTRIRADWPRLGIIVFGLGPAEATARFRELGCLIAHNLPTLRYLVPRTAARSKRAELFPFTSKVQRPAARPSADSLGPAAREVGA